MLLLLFIFQQEDMFLPELDPEPDPDPDDDYDDDPVVPIVDIAPDDVDERLRRGGQAVGRPENIQMIQMIEERKRAFREERAQIRTDRRDRARGEPIQCTKPHTHRAIGMDACVCDEGYFGYDPMEKGCWKCEEPCHMNAQCAEGGRCECLPGFVGDGVVQCDYDYPKIIDARPKLCVGGGCIINVTLDKEPLWYSKAVCIFGNAHVTAVRNSESFYSCRAPTIDTWKETLQFSYDGQHMSENTFILYFSRSVSFSDEDIMHVLLFVFLFVVIGLVLYKVKTRESRPPVGQKPRKRPKKSQYETL